jgi:pimeloyl-ACP methyl ester carboxylesterase
MSLEPKQRVTGDVVNLGRRWAARTMAAGGVAAMGTVLNACGGGNQAEACTAAFPSRAETFVLLHGSWHGGWCWNGVRSRLQAAGHDVLAPTFTGMSDRTRYGSADTGLVAHIDETVALLEAADLRNVVLVGHSYAGIVVSGVAERVSTRLKHLVYLDAFALRNGESAFSFFPPEIRDLFITLAQQVGNGWGVPAPPSAVDDFLGPVGNQQAAPAAVREFLSTRLTPVPLNTHAQTLAIPANRAAALPKTYISCKRFPNLDANKARVRTEAGWTYREIDTYHDAMLTAPQELTSLLLQAAA